MVFLANLGSNRKYVWFALFWYEKLGVRAEGDRKYHIFSFFV